MPIYVWFDHIQEKEFEIYRESFTQSGEEPTDDDLPAEEKGKERKWEKRIGSGIKVVRGASWNGSKGNW